MVENDINELKFTLYNILYIGSFDMIDIFYIALSEIVFMTPPNPFQALIKTMGNVTPPPPHKKKG